MTEPVAGHGPAAPPSLQARFEGTLLGLALGDALGYEVEFLPLAGIRARFGPEGIQEPVLHDGVARVSDDTRLSLAVAQGLLAAGREATCDSSAPHVAAALVAWAAHPPGGHRDPGHACLAGCHALAAGTPWEQAGHREAGGCGSVMRSAPYALRFWQDEATALECATRHSRMTHGHPLALAACAALVAGTWHALRDAPPLAMGRRMVEAAARHDADTARMLEEDLADADAVARDPGRRAAPSERLLARRRGWAGHEAVSAALYCALAGRDMADVLRLAANSPGDSDSIACIAGALAGARAGADALPARWVQVVEHRDALRATAHALLEASGA